MNQMLDLHKWKKFKYFICTKISCNRLKLSCKKLSMLGRTFIQEDFDDIQLVLKEKTFDWKDLLDEDEYEVASVKKYFSEIAKNNAW